MSPRPYNLGKRQEQIDQGRRQVLDAARTLLVETTSYTAFTVDAVAKRADVARATVYYQFGSKIGLLEALCDDLAEIGGIADLVLAFTDPDPLGAWQGFVTTFARFWDADRVAMRRLRALAALDAEVAEVITERDERRRRGVEVLVDRMADSNGSPGPDDGQRARTVRVLTALTSFETFDTLALPDQALADAAADVIALGQAALRGL